MSERTERPTIRVRDLALTGQPFAQSVRHRSKSAGAWCELIGPGGMAVGGFSL